MGKFVDNYLLFQLAAISHSLSDDFYGLLRERGVTPARWRVLVNLIDGDMYVTDLVHKTLYEQSRVTRIIDQLACEGLIERRVDDKDRRRITVAVTDRGRALTLPLIEAAKEHEERVLSALPEADRQALKITLARLVGTYFNHSNIDLSQINSKPADQIQKVLEG